MSAQPWRFFRPRLAPLLLLSLLAGCGQRQGPVDLANGERVFAARCASCHGLGPGAHNGFGPQLNALFGRQAGGAPGYAYSAAMKSSPIVWDETTLRAFIAAPKAVVPGTKMRFWGMSDERAVTDLLAYLRKAGAPAAVTPPAAPR